MSNLDRVSEHSSYKPFKAVVFYQNSDNKYYVEEANIENNSLKAGKPIKKSSFESLGKAIVQSKEGTRFKRELFNEKVLFAEEGLDSSLIVWKWTNRKAFLRFTEVLGIEEGVYPLPNLVFALVDKKDLYVYAVKTSNIKADTAVFKPPFFNILNGQKVCLGSSRLSNEDTSNVNSCIDTFEALFFESHFSGIHEGGNVKGNMVSLYKSLKDSKRAFPTAKLVSLQSYRVSSVSELIESL